MARKVRLEMKQKNMFFGDFVVHAPVCERAGRHVPSPGTVVSVYLYACD